MLETDPHKYDDLLDVKADNSLSLILRKIKPGSLVLEFGPAFGRMTRYLKEELGCRVFIVEIDRVGGQKAAEYAEGAFFGDIEKDAWSEEFRGLAFDYIIFADVLEHLYDPWETIKKAKELLADGGMLWLSIPNIAHNAVLIELLNNRFEYGAIGPLDVTHIRFFTYGSVLMMLNKAGLFPLEKMAVYETVGKTVLANTYQSVPPKIAGELRQREHGHLYQFVIGSVRQEFAELHGLQSKSHITGNSVRHTARLYLDNGQGCNEERSLVSPIYATDSAIGFDLPATEDIVAVRFDPCDFGIIFQLKAVVVQYDHGEIPIRKSTIGSNCAYNFEDVYFFTDEDPWFHVALQPLGVRPRGITFYFEFISMAFDLPDKVAGVLGRLEQKRQRLLTHHRSVLCQYRAALGREKIKNKIYQQVSGRRGGAAPLSVRSRHIESGPVDAFCAINHDPQIVLELSSAVQNLKVEIQVAAKNPDALMILYYRFDGDVTFTAEKACTLGRAGEGLSCLYLRMPRPVRWIRIDPVDVQTDFEIVEIKLSPISELSYRLARLGIGASRNAWINVADG